MDKRNWNESALGEMTFENICRLYSSDKTLNFTKNPPFIRAYYANDEGNQYAIRWNRRETGTNISSSGIEAVCFILNGTCEINIEKNTFLFQTGEYFSLPQSYTLEVTGNEHFEYVMVYKLPDDVSELKNDGDAFR